MKAASFIQGSVCPRFPLFWVEFSSIYVGFLFRARKALVGWSVGRSVGGGWAFGMEGDVKGRGAISVEPDRRLAVIGPASASRCKVGLLVFHWLLPSFACVRSWKNASLLGDLPPAPELLFGRNA